ncbi:hypothetical protein BOX15_Mlig023700g1 [Macrostomum lignano]|uniref:Ubiquitin-like domain-containing protein n=1 Tax=Macrostomum lignano TaxID=282301 RepID=A0A267DLV7_9PLAT|nr:hypothetical protein BOX15_Mlig023700g1 [Macrostomum lignano]
MRENNSPFCLEIRTPKGRFEFDAAPDSTISELRARIAEKMETDSGRVQLLAGGKTAPADGSLAEFLTPSPALSASAQPGMGLNNYRIYAICDRPPPKQPETPEAAEKSAKAREEVLDLMPSHIREDLDSGSTRFVDMVASWQHRMLESPENTRLQLQSRETRDLLACMRSPKPPTPAPHGQAPPIGLIGSDALIGEPQSNKLLQEFLSKQQQQLNSSNQVANIHQDIKFYQRMMQESMRMPPPPPPPPPQPTRGPSVQKSHNAWDASRGAAAARRRIGPQRLAAVEF